MSRELKGGVGETTNDDRIIGALARTGGHMSRSSRTPPFTILDGSWRVRWS